MSNEAWNTLNGFLRAEYGCEDSAPSRLRIGEPATTMSSRHWITAWNPLGLERGADANLAAQRELLTALAASGLQFEPGFARAPGATDKGWNEPCAVVIGATDGAIDALAHHFRQLAVVVRSADAPARLRCYRALWIERFGIADMDAPNTEWVA
jgi:hypothetical protein